jgi:Zn-dependent protease with chaperone function
MEQRAMTRWRLTALAVFGAAGYQVVMLAPFAAFLMLNPWTRYVGPWPVLPALLVIWWILQPHHEQLGRRLEREEAPALFEEIDRLADGLNAPRIDEVRLTDDMNAGASEVSSRRRPWRKTRVLLLGVPLLALADRDTLRAVIAHELGHFAHGHGRLGRWIHRARIGWLEQAERKPADVSLIERGGASFARWFAPRFAALSFEHSRQCEYEADAVGASLVGSEPMAAALLTVEAIGRRWQALHADELSQLMARQESPPADWIAHARGRMLGKPLTIDELAVARRAASSIDDTHPSLAERLQGLKVPVEPGLAACSTWGAAAGEAWISTWPAVVERHDRDWCARHASTWRHEHVRRRVQLARLDILRATDDQGLERARLELMHADAAVTEAIAPGWLADEEQAAHAHYLLGAAQLARGDRQGLATLETCVKRDPAWAASARALIDAHAGLVGDEPSRDRNRQLLDQARDRRQRAGDDVRRRLQRGEVNVPTLDDDSWTILREVYARTPVVAAAWIAGVDEVTVADRRYRAVVLVLRLRTEELARQGFFEDELCEDARALLANLLPGGVLRVVWTAYTTEALSPELDAVLTRWASERHRCCLLLPAPDEAVGPGVRAAALG